MANFSKITLVEVGRKDWREIRPEAQRPAGRIPFR